jgi:hypothetical protein
LDQEADWTSLGHGRFSSYFSWKAVSIYGVEDTTGAGPEYVSDDGERVQLRGCGNPSRRRAYDEDCKLARVKEPPLNVYAAFRCVYSR